MSIFGSDLKHFGTKGMRWGVRNEGSSGASTKPPKMSKMTDSKGHLLTKDDAKWVKNASSMKKGIEAHNRAADQMNKVHIPRINAKPAYKHVDVSKDTPLTRSYLKEMNKSFEKEFNTAAKDVFGDSPSGKYKVSHVQNDGLLPAWTIDYTTATHDALPPPPKLDVKYANGKVVSCSVTFGGDLIQSALDVGLDFLQHHGIKGMKWGVRRSKAGGSIVSHPSHPSSHDASTAKDLRTQAKKHGTASLTNQELQALTKRMNLEQQYSNLSGTSRGRATAKAGGKVVKEILLNVGKQTATNIISNQVAKQLPAALLKK